MENELQERNTAPARDIGVITAEIKSIQQQANALALIYAVEIGRRLKEAKSLLPYGTWGEWLKSEVDFSQSTANNFMRLFEEYGSAQISIFGASIDSQSFVNLPYSKALQLLAIPKEERESFAEEVRAEDLSVKELKEAIAERDKAQKMADMQKKLKEELAEKLKASEDARLEAIEKASDAEHLQGLLNEAEAETERAKKEAEDLRQKLKAEEKDPKIPKAKLDQIRKEVAEAERKEAESFAQKTIEEAKKQAKDAAEAVLRAKDAEKKAKEELEDLRKKLKTASPEVSAFKALFDQLQLTAGKLKMMIQTISRDDAETGGKLAAALRAFGGTL